MKVAVIGAGSWGTALAQVAGRAGNEVVLWARRPEVASAINANHANPDYLSDLQLSSSICATSSLGEAVEGADLVLLVTPSKAMGTTAADLGQTALGCSVPVVLCTKGVQGDSGLLLSQVLEEAIGNPERIACLSGPNHAEEVATGLPTGTVVASISEETALFVQRTLGSEPFRIYTSTDITGVQLCAAAKNVVAIAVGISYGLGNGDNTAAMLMTRGQAEMGRLVTALGGQALTCMGLAGTGDLIATCMSRHSRNRSFGEAVAQGETLEAYEARRHMVVEGAQACRTLMALAERWMVDVPLISAVNDVVWHGADPREQAKVLISRPFKPEFY